MKNTELLRLIDGCVDGSISPPEHAALQEQLKGDPQARAAFRERVDLEAALRTWASEGSKGVVGAEASSVGAAEQGRGRLMWSRPVRVGLAIAASVFVVAGALLVWQNRGIDRQAGKAPLAVVANAGSFLGTIARQDSCVWAADANLPTGQRVTTGGLALVSGAAELKLDSGTDLILQGPCDLRIDSGSEAELLGGSVVVHVTELSDGFTLRTPDATILDEGTEYAVSVDAEATEVHVFEGIVLWEPDPAETGSAERIPSGEARRYPRSRPFGGGSIPLGARRFVRRIEAAVQSGAGEGLVAYDGFENLAGRIQRDRGGFGWASGWESLGMRGHNNTGTIVDAPDGVAFGMSRGGRRQLRLSDGNAVRRDLERALPLGPGSVYYMSFIATRHGGSALSEGNLQVSLYGDERRRGLRARNEFAFGVSSDGYPFLKTGGKVILSAPGVANDVPCLIVGKVVVAEDGSTETSLRVYHAQDKVDQHEPLAWSASGTSGPVLFDLSRIRITTGTAAAFDIDELKLGRTWESVAAPRRPDE